MEAIIDRPSPTTTRSTPFSPRTTARPSASSRALTAKGYGYPPLSRPGRRPRQPEQRRSRQAVRRRLEERQRARQGRRRTPPSRCARALASKLRHVDRRSPRGRRTRRALHDAQGQHRDVDHPPADADHRGQPQVVDRRRVDHQGRPVQGRHGRIASPPAVTVSAARSRRPAPRFRRGAQGAFHPSRQGGVDDERGRRGTGDPVRRRSRRGVDRGTVARRSRSISACSA